MKKYLFVIASLILMILLAACGGTDSRANQSAALENVNLPATDDVLATVVDDQGAVSVAITPRTLEATAQTVSFDVAMDTHSVDLSMDLAALATLQTDTGRKVQALQWDAEPGGHHVSGTLIFPGTVAGAALLDGASQLTLTIEDVDASVRTFSWDLTR